MKFLRGFTKKETSWMMYDWANSAHSVVVVTILPIFYNTVADMMFGDELESFTVLYDFFEFRCRHTALGTTLGSLIAFMYITAYGADKFLFHNCLDFGV